MNYTLNLSNTMQDLYIKCSPVCDSVCTEINIKYLLLMIVCIVMTITIISLIYYFDNIIKKLK